MQSPQIAPGFFSAPMRQGSQPVNLHLYNCNSSQLYSHLHPCSTSMRHLEIPTPTPLNCHSPPSLFHLNCEPLTFTCFPCWKSTGSCQLHTRLFVPTPLTSSMLHYRAFLLQPRYDGVLSPRSGYSSLFWFPLFAAPPTCFPSSPVFFWNESVHFALTLVALLQLLRHLYRYNSDALPLMALSAHFCASSCLLFKCQWT